MTSPEPRILLLGPALSADDSAQSLEILSRVTLPNATKYVVTVGKFDAGKIAASFNIESGYPAEPSYLKSLAAWTETSDRSDPRLRDGYDLYCLRELVAKEGGNFDYVILLRETAGFEENWTDPQARVNGKTFLAFSSALSGGKGPNFLFSLRDQRAIKILDLALEIYFTGAAYAMKCYTLDGALTVAVETLGLLEEMCG